MKQMFSELSGSNPQDYGYEDVLNERLVELKYESYQKVYYINKAVIKITIKQEIKLINNKKEEDKIYN